MKRSHTRILGPVLGLLLALTLAPASGFAQVPHDAVYQGRLTDTVGAPLAGPVNLKLGIFDVLSGGTALYTEDHVGVVLDDNGVFTVRVGAGSLKVGVFDRELFSSGVNRYLQVVVDDEILTPRQPLSSVPYTLAAEYALVAEDVLIGSDPTNNINQFVTNTVNSFTSFGNDIDTLANDLIALGTALTNLTPAQLDPNVSAAEFGFLDGVTSSIQPQVDAAQAAATAAQGAADIAAATASAAQTTGDNAAAAAAHGHPFSSSTHNHTGTYATAHTGHAHNHTGTYATPHTGHTHNHTGTYATPAAVSTAQATADNASTAVGNLLVDVNSLQSSVSSNADAIAAHDAAPALEGCFWNTVASTGLGAQATGTCNFGHLVSGGCRHNSGPGRLIESASVANNGDPFTRASSIAWKCQYDAVTQFDLVLLCCSP